MKKIFYLALTISLISLSCSVEKRIYNSGYHVTWKNGKHKSNQNDVTAKYEIQKTEIAESEEIVKSNNSIIKESSNQSVGLNNGIKFEKSVSSESKAKSSTITSFKDGFKKIDLKKRVNHFSKKEIIKKVVQKSSSKKQDDTELILMVILCFLIPPIAVGLATDWDLETVVLNVILTLLCGLPGVIHALIVVLGKR